MVLKVIFQAFLFFLFFLWRGGGWGIPHWARFEIHCTLCKQILISSSHSSTRIAIIRYIFYWVVWNHGWVLNQKCFKHSLNLACLLVSSPLSNRIVCIRVKTINDKLYLFLLTDVLRCHHSGHCRISKRRTRFVYSYYNFKKFQSWAQKSLQFLVIGRLQNWCSDAIFFFFFVVIFSFKWYMLTWHGYWNQTKFPMHTEYGGCSIFWQCALNICGGTFVLICVSYSVIRLLIVSR